MGCCKKSNCAPSLTDEQKKILEALSQSDDPLACKEIAEKVGLTGNQVSCRIRSLKSKGFVDSPVRCKYTITAEGRAALGS